MIEYDMKSKNTFTVKEDPINVKKVKYVVSINIYFQKPLDTFCTTI